MTYAPLCQQCQTCYGCNKLEIPYYTGNNKCTAYARAEPTFRDKLEPELRKIRTSFRFDK